MRVATGSYLGRFLATLKDAASVSLDEFLVWESKRIQGILFYTLHLCFSVYLLSLWPFRGKQTDVPANSCAVQPLQSVSQIYKASILKLSQQYGAAWPMLIIAPKSGIISPMPTGPHALLYTYNDIIPIVNGGSSLEIPMIFQFWNSLVTPRHVPKTSPLSPTCPPLSTTAPRLGG